MKEKRQVGDQGMEIPIEKAKSLCLGHDEQYLIVCMTNGNVRIWDLDVEGSLVNSE